MRCLIVLLAFLVPLTAHAFELGLPVQCKIGSECFVQNYVDMAQGDAYQDFKCRKLSYNQHDGTDIRVPTMTEVEKGIPILAAADGVVLGIRDGMEDISIREGDPAKIKDKECGNGVVLQHAEGWQTQYCHMRRGSVSVAKGALVRMGETLGMIGMSGDAEFPHVHVSVRHNGTKIDPFTSQVMESGCGNEGTSLWKADATQALHYRDAGWLKSGFVSTEPTLPQVINGAVDGTRLPANAPRLIVWSLLYGLHAGDEVRMQLLAPDGANMAETRQSVDTAKAQYFQYIGKNRHETPWPVGTYQGRTAILRNGRMLFERVERFVVD